MGDVSRNLFMLVINCWSLYFRVAWVWFSSRAFKVSKLIFEKDVFTTFYYNIRLKNIGMSTILLCGLTILSLSSLNLRNNAVTLYRVSLKYETLYATFEVGFVGQQYLKIVSIIVLNLFFLYHMRPQIVGALTLSYGNMYLVAYQWTRQSNLNL